MQPHDKTMFLNALNAIFEVYGKPKLSVAAGQVWWDSLKDFDHTAVFTTINTWPQYHGKPPVPADIWQRLNDERTNTLEAKAAKEAQQNRGPLNWTGPTATGRRALRAIREMLAKPRPDPFQNWPNKIVERLKAGEQVPYYAMRCAAEAFEHDGKQKIAASIRARMTGTHQDGPGCTIYPWPMGQHREEV